MNLLELNLYFGPTMDCKRSQAYFTEPIGDLINKGLQIPVMIGYTSHEGIIFLKGKIHIILCEKYYYVCFFLSLFTLIFLIDEKVEWYETFKTDFEKILANDLHLDLNQVSDFAKAIRKFYFKDESNLIKQRDNCIDFKSDTMFNIGILDVIDKQLKKNTPTYVYRFSHNVQNSCFKILLKIKMEGIFLVYFSDFIA